MLRSFWPSRYRETKDRRFLERLYLIQLDQLQAIGPVAGLPSSQFQNILFTALKLGRVHWAEMFFNEFKGRIIGTQQQEMVIDILQAALFFYHHEFASAAKILPHYLHYGDLDDIYLYAIAARWMREFGMKWIPSTMIMPKICCVPLRRTSAATMPCQPTDAMKGSFFQSHHRTGQTPATT